MDSFLASTRIGHAEGLGSWNEEGLTALAGICRGMMLDRPDFRFVVLRSLSKSCEIRTIDKTDFILFDVQAIRCFNVLSECVYSMSSTSRIVPYLYKLMSEEAILGLELDIAKYSFEMFRHYVKIIGVPKSGSIPEELNKGSLNEFFLSLHECAHYLILRSRLPEVTDFGNIIVQDHRGENWRRQLYELNSDDFTSVEEFAEQTNMIDQTEKFVQKNRERVRAELACDAAAFTLMMTWCQSNNVSPLDAYRAAWLSLKHIRLLQSIKRYVMEFRGGYALTGVDDRVRLLDVRISRLMSSFLSTGPAMDVVKDTFALNKELVSTARAYQTRIEQPLASIVIPSLWHMKHSFGLKPSSLTQRVDLCYSVAAEMGWRPYATHFEHKTL